MPAGGDQHWEFMRKWGHPTSILRTFSLVGPQCGQHCTLKKKTFMCNSTKTKLSWWQLGHDAMMMLSSSFVIGFIRCRRANLNSLQRWLESMQEAIRVNIVISLLLIFSLSITSFSKSPYSQSYSNSIWNYILNTHNLWAPATWPESFVAAACK
jgi:hypothetical protein